MRAVNLLPQDAGRRGRKPLSPLALVAVLAAALVVTALAVAYLRADSAVEEKRAELERMRVQLAVTPRPRRAESAANPQLASEREKRATALASAFANRVSWDRLLRRFSLVLPNDVWLTSLSGTAPEASTDAPAPNAPGTATTTSGTGTTTGGAASTPVAAGAPSGFVAQGRSYSHAGVARLISRLETLPDLTNVQLQSSTLAELAGADVVEFTVLADVRPRGGPA